MKRLLTVFAFTVSSFLFSGSVQAEVIERFDVKAYLDADRSYVVTETIVYDFERSPDRHGIFRTIPESYSRLGAAYRLRLDVQEATMDGRPVPMKVTRQGSDLNIRLGDPDVTVTGKHTYTIRYLTRRAINDFPDDRERELYWNVTGDNWNVPIRSSSFELSGPAPASKLICYTGRFGSTEQDCSIESDGNTVRAKTTRGLLVREGFTVAMRFPESSIAALTIWDHAYALLIDNFWLVLPFAVFAVMFAIWYLRGRDPKGRGTVIAQYEEPRGLKPAHMSAMLEEHVSHRAISATILDLARRGYLKIHWDGDIADKGWFGTNPKFTLVKQKEEGTDMSRFEARLFQGMFEDGDSLRTDTYNASFWKAIQESRNQVFADLKSRKFIEGHPATARGLWIGLAFAVFFTSFVFLSEIYGFLVTVVGAVSALIIAGFGWLMPRATFEGAVVREEVEGFKLFLSVTEKDRLKFHNAPEKRPEQFERFLPAATAFGVEEQWAGHFRDLQMKPPSYMDGRASSWNALAFAHAIDSFNSESSSHMYRSPSSAGSGGSGFSGGGSGGGFGGGGGGSW